MVGRECTVLLLYFVYAIIIICNRNGTSLGRWVFWPIGTTRATMAVHIIIIIIRYCSAGLSETQSPFSELVVFYFPVSPRAVEEHIKVGSVLGHIGRSHGSKLRIRNAHDRAADFHETSVALQYKSCKYI